MRTSIATVSLSGTLELKLEAAAAAGFDGVEIFEPDLIASQLSPAHVRDLSAELGLTIDMYQPFRDFEGVSPEALEANLRRARHKFELMAELGADTLLVCSNVAADAIDDRELSAAQLHLLAEEAQQHGVRIAFEALAWGRHIADYRSAWDVVERGDHPALGTCLDSFHILARGDDPSGIEQIPGDRIFFLQLADAPAVSMDPLQLSRHHRCFPGQGGLDLGSFMAHVEAAGYAGPWSLEVFNDHFRQAHPARIAVDARRSLTALAEAAGPRRFLPRPEPRASRSPSSPSDPRWRRAWPRSSRRWGSRTLGRIVRSRLTLAAGARPDPAQPWGSHRRGGRAGLRARHRLLGPGWSSSAGGGLGTPLLPRTRGPREADLVSIGAPDQTSVLFCHTATIAGTRGSTTSSSSTRRPATAVDHRGRSHRALAAVRLLRRGGPLLPLGSRAGALPERGPGRSRRPARLARARGAGRGRAPGDHGAAARRRWPPR